jgi:hypothetical protein
MSGDAPGRRAHDRVMMREMPGHGSGDGAAQAALRLRRRRDGQTCGQSEDQGSTNDTHGSLPELVNQRQQRGSAVLAPIKSAYAD